MRAPKYNEVVVSGGRFGIRGGIETHVERWCREFAGKGCRVTLVVSAEAESGERLGVLRNLGIHCVDIGAGGPLRRALSVAALGLRYRGRGVLYYSNGYGGVGPLLGSLMKPRFWVHHHHANYARGDFSQWPGPQQKLVQKADRFITCAQVHADRFEADTASGKGVFVPCLKSEGELLPAPATERPVVGFMGMVKRSKGVPLLLENASWFESHGYRLALWGRDADGLTAGGLPEGVQWRGEYDPESDIDRILGSVSCLALPFTEGEGLPIVISEALSRGVPVVALSFAGVEWLKDLHPGLAVVNGGFSEMCPHIDRLVRAGRDPAFRRSLRASYQARLGNERCLSWWEQHIYHGN